MPIVTKANLDFNKNGAVVGVEFLDLTSHTQEKELSSLQFQIENQEELQPTA